jgi:hypothetical protein
MSLTSGGLNRPFTVASNGLLDLNHNDVGATDFLCRYSANERKRLIFETHEADTKNMLVVRIKDIREDEKMKSRAPLFLVTPAKLTPAAAACTDDACVGNF